MPSNQPQVTKIRLRLRQIESLVQSLSDFTALNWRAMCPSVRGRTGFHGLCTGMWTPKYNELQGIEGQLVAMGLKTSSKEI